MGRGRVREGGAHRRVVGDVDDRSADAQPPSDDRPAASASRSRGCRRASPGRRTRRAPRQRRGRYRWRRPSRERACRGRRRGAPSRSGVDAHPARTSTFIASSGLSIAKAMAAGAPSKRVFVRDQRLLPGAAARDEVDRLCEVLGAAGADAEHVELAERERAERRATSCVESPTTSTRPVCATASRAACIGSCAPVASTTTSGSSRLPSLDGGDEIVARLEQCEVCARRPSALEPRAIRSAISTRAPRSSAAIAVACPIGPAPRTARVRPAKRVRDHRRTAIDMGSMKAREPRVRVRHREGLGARNRDALLQCAVAVDADRRIRAQALPSPSAQAWHDPQAITGQTATRWPGRARRAVGPTSSTIAENSCPWMRG